MKSIIQAQAEKDIKSGSKEDDFKDNNPTEVRTKKVKVQLEDNCDFPNNDETQ